MAFAASPAWQENAPLQFAEKAPMVVILSEAKNLSALFVLIQERLFA
jgi:hypothetical protein